MLGAILCFAGLGLAIYHLYAKDQLTKAGEYKIKKLVTYITVE